MTTTAAPARWYPNQPPALSDETDDAYTNRLLNGGVYDHHRNRQCSIGWHGECSDREHSGRCECPCHEERRNANELVTAWNAANPPGTAVTLPLAPEESPSVTSGPAEVSETGWPVVPVVGFPRPVGMAWLAVQR